MKKTIAVMLAFLLLSIGAYAQTETGLRYVAGLNIDPNSGVVDYEDLDVVPGSGISEASEESGLVISLYDYENTLLYYSYFSVDLSGSEEVFLTMTLPYFYEGAFLDVYLPNGTLAGSIDVRNFAQCNQNAVCDDNEFFETCPLDCALESQYPQKSKWIWYVVLAGLIGYGAFKLANKKKRIVK
ncbi:TPA: hypothetical protein H1008_03265 [archaeon]|nr:hypothetical protein [Candidatus Undinarchaeales archaeon SRR5007147.bin71]